MPKCLKKLLKTKGSAKLLVLLNHENSTYNYFVLSYWCSLIRTIRGKAKFADCNSGCARIRIWYDAAFQYTKKR